MTKNNIEKYHIRKAFDKTELLPEEILWRPKEGFSDGVSSVKKSWYESLQEFIETQVRGRIVTKTDTKFFHISPVYTFITCTQPITGCTVRAGGCLK